MNKGEMEIETPEQREIPLETEDPKSGRKYLPMEWVAPSLLQRQ